MRYGELFAGAGGLSLGLDRAGFECAFHAEIEPFPRRVLKHHWPDVPLYGDVMTLNGRQLIEECGPIDLLSGGSPCQDLSVAGNRAGLNGGERSVLFYEQMRLWDETDAALCLWENVYGALSSNGGKDFALVLSAFVGGTVIVPRNGWGGEVQVWFLARPEWPVGESLTLNGSEFRSAAAASLSSVLEPAESIPPKYYLSQEACAGIIRRAENRGKALPPVLEAALNARAAMPKE